MKPNPEMNLRNKGRVVPRSELTRYRDHRGCFHQYCPHCNLMVILLDDEDEHWCEEAERDTPVR